MSQELFIMLFIMALITLALGGLTWLLVHLLSSQKLEKKLIATVKSDADVMKDYLEMKKSLSGGLSLEIVLDRESEWADELTGTNFNESLRRERIRWEYRDAVRNNKEWQPTNQEEKIYKMVPIEKVE